MANQYTGSLEHKVRERFGCSARELLEQFARENITYSDAIERIGGVTGGTIRKWVRRYGLELRSEDRVREEDDRMEKFYASEINVVNFLSRPWGC